MPRMRAAKLTITLAMTTLPMIIVFILLQKQMIKGLTAGAVKG